MAIKSKTNYIERELHTSVTRWIKEREIIAISGSRQAGKTTLLKQIMLEVNATQKIFIDLEQSTELEAFNRNPNEYIQLKVDLSNKAYIFIDEIQYLNSAGKILKELYDKYPKLKLIISGSSSLKIKDIACLFLKFSKLNSHKIQDLNCKFLAFFYHSFSIQRNCLSAHRPFYNTADFLQRFFVVFAFPHY